MDKHLDKQQLDYIVSAINSVPAFTPTEDTAEFAKNKVLNVLSSQGFKHPNSKKAMDFITNKPLVYELEKGKFFAIYVIYQPEMCGMYRMLIAMKTKSGIVYVDNDEFGKSGFMSHFFDRFAQRTGECTLVQREKAIRRYLQTDKLSPGGNFAHSTQIDDDTKKLILLHPKGVCLGFKYKECQILKTFILYDGMRDKQKKTVDIISKLNEVQKRHAVLISRKSKGIILNDEIRELEQVEEVLSRTGRQATNELNEFDDSE